MKAIITNIQGYSIHDGPGIRTVVFFKGCPLRCRWCANPEGLTPGIQIGFIANLCTDCRKCFAVCPENALADDSVSHRIDYTKCTACGKCVDACSYKALVRYGAEMTVDEVFDAVRRDKMFYDTSGGGVTVSGGEPLLHPGFIKELFQLCRDAGIDTCVETSGCVPAQNLLDVLPLTDHLLFDLKQLDSERHREYTAQPNELLLKNAALAAESGADILFRVPLIPGVNDDDKNIEATAAFILGLPGHQSLQLMPGMGGAAGEGHTQRPRLQLMPYHRLGESKYKALGMTNTMGGTQVMTPEQLEAVKQKYLKFGVDCTLST